MTESLLDTLNVTSQHSRSTVEAVLTARRGDEEYKSFARTWKRTDVMQMLDISVRELIQVSNDLDIEPDKVANKFEYTWEQIQRIRHSTTERKTPETLPVISVMSGKGGCSKTTFSVYLAQKLVLEGKRVLFIDTDPQASATSILLAVNPDIAFEPDDTIAPFMMGHDINLADQAIATGMHGLDIIPCCQGASIMDLQGIAGDSTSQTEVVERFWMLRETLAGFKDKYDVLIIDTPPTVTFTNIRCAIASNLIISPIAPSMTDICSSTGYENTLRDYLESLLAVVPDKPLEIHARRFLISQYDHRLQSHRNFAELIRQTYPTTYATPFSNLAEISNTNENGNTIYEERSAINSSATRKKALTMLDYLFDEVIGDINTLAGTTRKASELPEVSHG